MNLSDYAVRHRAVVLFAAALLLVGGLYAYGRLGKLEDPEFTIKTATVVTLYPGASAAEVELQVTDVIEKAAQELEKLDKVRSVSKAGMSIVFVDIQEQYRQKDLPQIWDKLRRKIHDTEPLLPPGAHRPEVFDDYGDVFGVFLALTGDGFSYAELKDYALFIQRELLLVDDVNRVELWGTQTECIYVEISRPRLAGLGIHPGSIIAALQQQNLMVDAGRLEAGSERIRIAPSGTFSTLEDIGNLVISGAAPDELVLLRDIASISRDYLEPSRAMLRYNGAPAVGIAISTVSGGNVVTMGDDVKNRLQELMQLLPVGLDIGPISYQAITVKRAIKQFVTNLAEALAIVIGILLITMGIRSGLLIGAALVLSIVGTFVVMLPLGIDLQRASLGALIIAMGMLVDNAIVVTEGSLIRLQRGDDRRKAAIRPAVETAWPLFGATLVAILAFAPIYFARDNTGEYCESIFQVVGISLGLSWVIAMTLTPVLCDLFLRVHTDKQGTDPYTGPIYRNYRFVLTMALRFRKTTLLTMLVLLVCAVFGFRFVDKIFFPNSDFTKFMVEYWLPEGSRIQDVSQDMRQIEQHLQQYPEVVNVTTCIGEGAPRFILDYEPEIPNSSYGMLLINVRMLKDIDKIYPQVERYLKTAFPQAEPRLRRFPLGPFVPYKIEARLSGPDPRVLRKLSEQVKAVMQTDPQTKDTRDNWRQRVKVLQPEFSQPRSRRALVTRPDIAAALTVSTDGMPVGIYRDHDELLPILVRSPEDERRDITGLEHTPVRGSGPASLPLRQVLSDMKTVWEDPIIQRYNRRRTITAQTNPVTGITANEVLARIQPKIEALELPPGYYLEWGGEFEIDGDSNKAVFAPLPIAFLIMVFIIVALFNAYRQPLIILLILPLSLVGITVGLLLTGQPFGFMALLGALSLFGMLTKNAVVLLSQIDTEIKSGQEPYSAVVTSSISRMRPVLMASFTTVLGMTPLLTDRLFGAMAVTIMFGLTFATVLTLIVVPVLYTMFFKITKA
ncbi:MAG: efflux RND transporter permease subunit [Deltaproteobacteria bacterium]|nr:efflux RND transporter permease subunit [Deltaproteobacteria bacterium]